MSDPDETLRRLFGDALADALGSEGGTERPARGRASAELLAELDAQPILTDLEHALRVSPSAAIFAGDGFTPTLGRPTDARAFYERGHVVYLFDQQLASPPLRRLCARIAHALGVPPEEVTCESFWAPGPATVGMHYDLDSNFNVQLEGHKRWAIAPNRHIANPARSYHVGSGSGLAEEPWAKALPTEMPDDATRLELSPSDVVFVPRGAWHETRVEGRSRAVSFTVKGPRLIDLVLGELTRRLGARPEWRAFAIGASGDAAARARVVAALDARLEELRAVVAALDGARVLAGATPAARRLAPGTYAFREPPVRDGHALRIGEIRFEMDPAMDALTEWLATRREPFEAADAIAACPGELPPFVTHVLERLVERGALTRGSRLGRPRGLAVNR